MQYPVQYPERLAVATDSPKPPVPLLRSGELVFGLYGVRTRANDNLVALPCYTEAGKTDANAEIPERLLSQMAQGNIQHLNAQLASSEPESTVECIEMDRAWWPALHACNKAKAVATDGALLISLATGHPVGKTKKQEKSQKAKTATALH